MDAWQSTEQELRSRNRLMRVAAVLAWSAVLGLIAAVLMLATGCDPAPVPTMTRHLIVQHATPDGRSIGPAMLLTIHCADFYAVQTESQKRGMSHVEKWGFWRQLGPNRAEMWVSWSEAKDQHGRPLPRFDTLGHEWWHAPMFGGLDWHK